MNHEAIRERSSKEQSHASRVDAMRNTNRPFGFSLTELLSLLVVVTVLVSLVIPALAGGRGDSMVQQSMNNLMTLSVAHIMHAADFNGRQVTFTADDLSAFGDSMEDYNLAHGCDDYFDEDCIPPIIAGWGDGPGGSGLYSFWSHLPAHYWAFQPMGFPGGNGIEAFGHFRMPNAKRFHDYVNGRFYDPTFYAPKDAIPLADVTPWFNEPDEFEPEGNPPRWSSYVFSPAAMYHADVMRSNSTGGWQDPWSIDNGFESPGLFQASFPDLKTLMIEHHWLQSPPGDCNPGFDPIGNPYECHPYLFNHGIDSSPVTLFYDGHIRLLPNTEVFAADQQVLKDTGGVDGLWHRGTPFGIDGYYIPFGFDDVPLSHHILTTDGILGRDTLGGMGATTSNSVFFEPRKRRGGHVVDRDNDVVKTPVASFEVILQEP